MLIARTDTSDALHQKYAKAASGQTTGLTVLYEDSRYVLVSVNSGFNSKKIQANNSNTGALISVN
jgi:hypothetical protein